MIRVTQNFTLLTNNSYNKKNISHTIHANLSQCYFKELKISYTCYMCTQRYQSSTVYSLQTYRVQFLSLLTKMKPKLIETETTLGEFPCETMEGPIESQHKLKLK